MILLVAFVDELKCMKCTPKTGHANPVCGHSVSDGKNGTKIDKSQRRDYTLTQPVFCPINGVHLILPYG